MLYREEIGKAEYEGHIGKVISQNGTHFFEYAEEGKFILQPLNTKQFESFLETREITEDESDGDYVDVQANDIISSSQSSQSSQSNYSNQIAVINEKFDKFELSTKQQNQCVKLYKSIQKGSLVEIVDFGKAVCKNSIKKSNETKELISKNSDKEGRELISNLNSILDKINMKEIQQIKNPTPKTFWGKITNIASTKPKQILAKYESITSQINMLQTTTGEWELKLKNNNITIAKMIENHRQTIEDISELLETVKATLNVIDVEMPEGKAKATIKDMLQTKIVDLEIQRQSSGQQIEMLEITQQTNFKIYQKINSSYNSTLPILDATIASQLVNKEHDSILTTMDEVDTKTRELVIASANMTIEMGKKVRETLDPSASIEAFMEAQQIIKDGVAEIDQIMLQQANELEQKIELLEEMSDDMKQGLISIGNNSKLLK